MAIDHPSIHHHLSASGRVKTWAISVSNTIPPSTVQYRSQMPRGGGWSDRVGHQAGTHSASQRDKGQPLGCSCTRICTGADGRRVHRMRSASTSLPVLRSSFLQQLRITAAPFVLCRHGDQCHEAHSVDETQTRPGGSQPGGQRRRPVLGPRLVPLRSNQPGSSGLPWPALRGIRGTKARRRKEEQHPSAEEREDGPIASIPASRARHVANLPDRRGMDGERPLLRSTMATMATVA